EQGCAGGCIFAMFLVKRKDADKPRPVVNMRPLSPFVRSPHFKMEGLPVAKELSQRGSWLARVDLKDAYLHVPIHVGFRKYFRYRYKGEVFQWQVLPFGFRDAPRLFQKMIVEAVAPLRRIGEISIIPR